MEPIRVLHIVTRMDAGGIETLLMNYYRNIDRSKVQFDFLTRKKDKGFYDDEILQLGGNIYTISVDTPLKYRNFLKDLDDFFCQNKRYRIIHSHVNSHCYLQAAAKNNIPIRIAHSHIANVSINSKTPFRFYAKLKLKNYTTHNFACSEIAGKWLFGKKAIKRDNFKIVNNSVDILKFAHNHDVTQRLRHKLGLDGKFVLGHIGRFTKQKNHLFLIDIFKKVYEMNPNSVLVLIGDGKLRTIVEEKVRRLNLDRNVIFTGIRPDIPELLQTLDVFVFPSLYEGLGIVAIEAQATGIKCIVSDRIPQEAFITDLIDGISLKADETVWANSIIKFSAGYERIDTSEQIKQKGYDIRDTTQWLEDFYLNCLNVKV